jgi:hypothetical protein
MLRNILAGVAAGAVGTFALDTVTYLDMTLRGRPASETPAKAAEKIAARVGADLSAGAQQNDQREQVASNRQQGLGALMGYWTGIGVGAAYGLLRPLLRDVPLPLAAATLGLAAMLAGDAPLVGLGVTDPREWDTKSWLSDLVPHLAFGIGAALVFDAICEAPSRTIAGRVGLDAWRRAWRR